MAKIKDLKEQNPNYNIDVIQVLSTMDPTKTNIYRLWLNVLRIG